MFKPLDWFCASLEWPLFEIPLQTKSNLKLFKLWLPCLVWKSLKIKKYMCIYTTFFTLGSVYSTKASGAKQTTETSDSKWTINIIKNPNWLEANLWLFTSGAEDLNLGLSWNKSRKWWERDSYPEPLDCKFDLFTTWPRCLLLLSVCSLAHSVCCVFKLSLH